jgi:hypothetical protein
LKTSPALKEKSTADAGNAGVTGYHNIPVVFFFARTAAGGSGIGFRAGGVKTH